MSDYCKGHCPGVCEACRYWQREEPMTGGAVAVFGACHRSAPRPLVRTLEGGAHAEWPRLWHHDWCGEWAAKNQP